MILLLVTIQSAVGASGGTNLTPILIGTLGAALGGIIVAVLTLGPQRRSLKAAAIQLGEEGEKDRAQRQESIVNSIDTVRKALEERLTIAEKELDTARGQIDKLERELDLAKAQRGRSNAEAELERERLQQRIAELEREVHDLRGRLPEGIEGRRTTDASRQSVGRRGPAGPTGATGPRGRSGETGAGGAGGGAGGTGAKGEKGDRGEPARRRR